jgi:hypothetical protein
VGNTIHNRVSSRIRTTYTTSDLIDEYVKGAYGVDVDHQAGSSSGYKRPKV